MYGRTGGNPLPSPHHSWQDSEPGGLHDDRPYSACLFERASSTNRSYRRGIIGGVPCGGMPARRGMDDDRSGPRRGPGLFQHRPRPHAAPKRRWWRRLLYSPSSRLNCVAATEQQQRQPGPDRAGAVPDCDERIPVVVSCRHTGGRNALAQRAARRPRIRAAEIAGRHDVSVDDPRRFQSVLVSM